MPRCKWSIKSEITDKAKKFSKELGLSPVVSQILINRGIKDKITANEFLSPVLSNLPDPFEMSDMEKAAKRLAQAVLDKKKVCIYGDYDIDGTASIVVILIFLKQLGCSVDYYQPGRFDEGYGLHVESAKEIKKNGIDLLISVDCGTSSYETATYCKSIGLDLIITDHHKIGKQLPEAYAFVNPHKGEKNDNLFTKLAGVGVAYYLVIATRKILRDLGYFKGSIQEPNLKDYLDIVAFGTVADVVPLTGMNRTFVKSGLDILNSDNTRNGFKALSVASGLNKQIDTEGIGYILAPRLNAAGRMGQASRAVELMIADDMEKAMELANELNDENKKRLSFQNTVWDEACSLVDQIVQSNKEYLDSIHSLVFASQDWHQGVVGIVASKSVDKWYKPTAVFSISSDGIAKGSARSVEGVDLFEVISEFGDLFEKFGGHGMAAGMSLKADRLDKFKELFENGISKRIASEDLKPILDIDLEVNVKDIVMQTVDELSILEPFGYDNPAPLFISTDTGIINKWILKEKHLKLKLSNGIEAIGFNMSDYADQIGNKINMVFKPGFNEWNGTKKLQYRLVDLE